MCSEYVTRWKSLGNSTMTNMAGSSRRYRWLKALILGCSVSAACSSPVEREIVVGKYVGVRNGASEILDLRADGTYSQTYKPHEGEQLLRTNIWEFETVSGAPNVVLHDFRPFLYKERFPTEGIFLIRATKTWGKIQLTSLDEVFYQKEQ